MRLIALLLKRLAYAVGLVLAVLTINFVLIHAAPGDPALVIAGEMGGADAEVLAQIRKTYGLDRVILPGDRVAFVPRGIPGPHRFTLGIYSAGRGEGRSDP